MDAGSELRWEIGEFGARLRAARPADQWASPLFVLERGEDGLVFFFLQFYPKGVQTGGRPALFFKVAQFTAPVLELAVVAETWLEAGDGQKSETKVSVLEFADGSTYEPWESFFSAIQLEFFEAAPRLAVRLRLPFAARQAAAHPGAWLQRRWPIPDFAAKLKRPPYDQWDSGEIRVGDAAFFLRLQPKNLVGAEEHVGVYLHAAGLGERAPLVCEAELWLESETGERLHKCAASILFDSLGGWGCRNYATLKNVKKLSEKRVENRPPPDGKVNVRLRLRLWGDEPPAAPPVVAPTPPLPLERPVETPVEEPTSSRASTASVQRAASPAPSEPPPPPVVAAAKAEVPAFRPGVVATLDVAALSDAEVHAKGRVFKVSRAVLAAASPRFWALFADASAPEATSGVVRVDAEPALVHALLLAAYGAPLPEDAPVERLLPLAVEFQLEGLITACSDALVAALTLENVFERLELAARPQQPARLRTAVFRFARQHLAQLAGLKPFIQFAQQQPTILSAVCALEEPSRP